MFVRDACRNGQQNSSRLFWAIGVDVEVDHIQVQHDLSFLKFVVEIEYLSLSIDQMAKRSKRNVYKREEESRVEKRREEKRSDEKITTSALN